MFAKLVARVPMPDASEPTRVRHARVYLLLFRPLLLTVATLMTAFDMAVAPGSIEPALPWIVLIFLVMQVPWTVLVRRGAQPLRIIGWSFAIDTVLLLATVVFAPHPDTASGAIVILLAVVGYFFSARATVVYAAVAALGIAVIGPLLDAWRDPAPIPVMSRIVLLTGLLMAMHASRERDDEEQLERLVEEQREALERLRQVGRARHRLIANVSHELRTPLTSMIGSIETLQRDDLTLDDASRSALLDMAASGSHRLLALVEDLLTLGATRPDSVRLDLRELRLSSLVHEAVMETEQGREDRDRLVRVEALDDPVVVADRQRILQVIGNLVANAIHHGGGTIVVETCSAPDGAAEVHVFDEGAGIEPANVRELFLPFARFSDRTDSTGLGLAISRTIAEAHGGTLTYARADSRTCFTLRIPRVAEDRPVIEA